MADPVRVWLIGGSSEVNPDDLARAIREGVDARLWALATVAETLGENGAKIASVLGHFFDAATSREPAPPEITALERWYNEGRKARIDGTPCPYQARTLATFMHSKGWLAEDLRQSLAHADPVYGEDQRRSDSPYPILAPREPAQERPPGGADPLLPGLRAALEELERVWASPFSPEKMRTWLDAEIARREGRTAWRGVEPGETT